MVIRCSVCVGQFAAWVDAVVFVFSLEDEISFQTVYNYFLRLSSYRNANEVPMVLVGTQGERRKHTLMLTSDSMSAMLTTGHTGSLLMPNSKTVLIHSVLLADIVKYHYFY